MFSGAGVARSRRRRVSSSVLPFFFVYKLLSHLVLVFLPFVLLMCRNGESSRWFPQRRRSARALDLDLVMSLFIWLFISTAQNRQISSPTSVQSDMHLSLIVSSVTTPHCTGTDAQPFLPPMLIGYPLKSSSISSPESDESMYPPAETSYHFTSARSESNLRVDIKSLNLCLTPSLVTVMHLMQNLIYDFVDVHQQSYLCANVLDKHCCCSASLRLAALPQILVKLISFSWSEFFEKTNLYMELEPALASMYRVHLAQSRVVVLKLRPLFIQPSQVSRVCNSSTFVTITVEFQGPSSLFLSVISRTLILSVFVEIHLVSYRSLVGARAVLARSTSFQTLLFGLINVDSDYFMLVVVTYSGMHLMIFHGSPLVEQVSLVNFVISYFTVLSFVHQTVEDPSGYYLVTVAPDVNV